MYPKLLIIIRNNQFCVQDTTFSQFRFKKGQKNEFYDPEIVTADNKNAIETPFLVVLRPQKGMGGITIGFQEKSNFFSSISLDLGVKIAVFPQGGRLTPPPTAGRVKMQLDILKICCSNVLDNKMLTTLKSEVQSFFDQI